eukprot:5989064-Heterocapsa_arctica.AAC.1
MDIENQNKDQTHEYVHEGMLHRKAQEDNQDVTITQIEDKTQEHELNANGQRGEYEQQHSIQQDQGGTIQDEEQKQENIQTQHYDN